MSSDGQYSSTYGGLRQLVKRLRGSGGCPWDREQTPDSMRRYILEECYELIEAIERGDDEKLAEELGDVVFHVVFQIQMGQERRKLSHRQVFQSVVEKLIRRHPHVFGDVSAADAQQVEARWEDIKREEKTATDASILEGVPTSMPALSYAEVVQGRAARSRFDWEDFQGVVEKVAEELAELEKVESKAERERELGDLLFSVVNAARWLGVDAEGALRQANARFYGRFSTMERLSRERGLSFPDLPLDHKEALWQEAKRLEG